MKTDTAIVIIGTFDTKGEEHIFIKERVEERGLETITVNLGTKTDPAFPADIDLYDELKKNDRAFSGGRDKRVKAMIRLGQQTVRELYGLNRISGIIGAGGGTGTHLCSEVMKVLPMGIPKVMVSTVAARDMSDIVSTSDITMMHSVTDILGINSITGPVLDRAAAAVCGMTGAVWEAPQDKKRIALSFFGFITPAAEKVREGLEAKGYEVVPFHANGTGGMAMVKLAGEGFFDGILDLATHELADALKGGYCGNIGPRRFEPPGGRPLPRLIVPGGMDCAVLEFTRDTVPEKYKDRKIFFYDFRSAVRLSPEESLFLAEQLSEKLNMDQGNVHMLIPSRGFSTADREGAPLYEPETGRSFIDRLKDRLAPVIPVKEVDLHINDPAFAEEAATRMDHLIKTAASSDGLP
jgi:uncharacterized protein (UPF0261 family)